MPKAKTSNNKKTNTTQNKKNKNNNKTLDISNDPHKLPFVIKYQAKQNIEYDSFFNEKSFQQYSLTQDEEFAEKYVKGSELLQKILKEHQPKSKPSAKRPKPNNKSDLLAPTKGVYTSQSTQMLIKPPGSNTVKKIRLILKPQSN